MKSALWLLVLLSLSWSPARAQCDSTPAECFDETYDAARDATAEPQSPSAERAREALAAQSSDLLELLPATPLVAIASGTLRSALAPQQAGLLAGGDDGGGASRFAFAASDQALGLNPSSYGLQSRLSAPVDAEVSELVAARMRESGRGRQIDELNDALNTADDLDIDLAVVVHRGPFGRDPKRYRHMFDGLVRAFYQQADTPASYLTVDEALANAAARNAQLRVPRCDPDATVLDPDAGPDADFGAVDPACRQLIKEEIDKVVDLKARGIDALEASADRARLADFGRLLSHQSQLVVSVFRAERDELVGADLTALRVRWEISFAGIEALRRKEQDCAAELDQPVTQTFNPWSRCLKKYTTYVENLQDDMDTGHRFALNLSYGRLSELQVDLDDYLQAEGSAGGDTGGSPLAPLDPLLDPLLGGDGGGGGGGRGSAGLAFGEGPEVDLPATNVLSFTAAYGRQLQAPTPGDPLQRASRLDIAADYEHFGSAVGRRDRWSLTATLSYQIAGLSFPFQLGYRSNSGFDDVPLEDELRALAGVAMDLGSPPSLSLGR